MAKITEIRVNEVVELLLKGKVRKEIIPICMKKYGIRIDAVDKLIQRARPLALERSKRLSEKMEAKQVEIIESQTVIDTLSYLEKRQINAKIARAELKIDDTYITTYKGRIKTKAIKRLPNHQQVINAIEVDNKMTGDNAPDKVAIASSIQITVKHDEDKIAIENTTLPGL